MRHQGFALPVDQTLVAAAHTLPATAGKDEDGAKGSARLPLPL